MNQFVVSARKYRPVHFDEVIGQAHVSSTLKNALQKEQLAHAFLFCGPRGVGKTTCARILAKVLNCEAPIDKSRACDNCRSCQAFQNNASFNIIELDAASNNSVEHIRTLTDQVRFQPQHGRYKVFIIDEVHMLSQAAFNAFLKTLEEPPPYAIFILATTEKHKILPTILSRCQIFDFRRIQIADMVAQLKTIAQAEGMEAEEEALHTIALKADGAMRDALSIFDRLVSSADGHLTYQDVIANLNILDYDYYFRLTNFFLQEDLSSVLILFDDVLRMGFEADLFAQGLSEHFRNLLLCKSAPTIAILEVSESVQARYVDQAQMTSTSFLMSALAILNTCDIHYPRAKNKRLHVEIALSRINYVHRRIETPGHSISVEKKTPDNSVRTGAVTPPNAEQQAQAPKPVEPVSEVIREDANGTEDVVRDTPSLNSLDQLFTKAKAHVRSNEEQELPFTLEKVQEVWDAYVDAMDSPSFRAMFNKVILETTDDSLIVKVGSQVAKEMVLQESTLFQQIRTKLNRPQMDLVLQIEPELFPDSKVEMPKRYLTTKEKYDRLVEQNPLVPKLIQTLDLKLEND